MAKHKKRKPRAWTDDEIEFLRRNYGPLSAKQIANRLDRPVSSVFKKMQKLGIKPYSSPTKSDKKRLCFEDIVAKWHPGDKVRVSLPDLKSNKKVMRQARILEVCERFILVLFGEGWKECINVGSLIAGDASIKLLEGGKAS